MFTAPPSVVTVREIAPEDEPALCAFLGTLSTESIYRRFFTAAADLRRAARAFTHPVGAGDVGLIAEAEGRIVGHAALVRIGERCGEVAFETAEDFREHGVATRLLAALEERATALGYERLCADVLAENRPMLEILRHERTTMERRDGTVIHVCFALGA